MDINNISLELIGLSNRSKNALLREGFECLGDVLGLTEAEIYTMPNLGVKSVNEILEKIEEYRIIAKLDEDEFFFKWITTENGEACLNYYLKKCNEKIDVLELLSAKAYNVLKLNGRTYIYEIATLSKEALMDIPHMDMVCVDEIVKLVRHYIREHKQAIIEVYINSLLTTGDINSVVEDNSFFAWICKEENTERVLTYIDNNNISIEELGLSNRGKNQLLKQGYSTIRDIIFMKENEFSQLPAMGQNTVVDILEKRDGFLSKHEERIRAFCSGDESVLWEDKAIDSMILNLYAKTPFGGFSLSEFINVLNLPEHVDIERLKNRIGSLLASGELEYVDYRCYRVYEKFENYLFECEKLEDRDREFIQKKLSGLTLEAIGEEYGVTRERVRQVIHKQIKKIQDDYFVNTGKRYFDEDYYRYLYETYTVDKNVGSSWLGISNSVWRYLELLDLKKGKKDLEEALEDRNIDAGLRLKIKTYVNRNKLFLDGVWVEKNRTAIEEYIVQKICLEDISYEDFCKKYNEHLEEQDVSYDENIYYTETVYRTRKNRLGESRKILWKFNEQIRYYDIDSRDYTELLDTIGIELYENIEISTLKFIEDFPEIMERYDIRDQYELHNLLRKIVPEGSYNNFRCGRMPNIIFGEFDKQDAILNLMKNNAPISADDLVDLIHKEYGYDKKTILATYLPQLFAYNNDGIYDVHQKIMPECRMGVLKETLNEDFYLIEEIRSIYISLFPNSDIEEVNSYNLKKMGFIVLSNHVVQNHRNLEQYFRAVLTKDDITDIKAYKKRFTYVPGFYKLFMELRRNLEVVEFEPNKIISIRKLENSGITKDSIKEFCNKVYDYIDDDTYFSAKSLRESGFESELYDLGFSDYFYANLLLSDTRFSFTMIYGSMVFFKGNKKITIRSFLESRVNHHESIDVFDLMSEIENVYGCTVNDKWDVIYKVQDSEVFYDKYLDRLYANEELFYHELDTVKY